MKLDEQKSTTKIEFTMESGQLYLCSEQIIKMKHLVPKCMSVSNNADQKEILDFLALISQDIGLINTLPTQQSSSSTTGGRYDW